MKLSQWVRLVVLAFAVMSAVGVIALVACAPAAPASQSGGGSGSGGKENPTETPTLTPTLHPDCVTLTLPDGGTGVSCPPPGPENVEGNLRRHYNRVMATKEAQAGRRSVVEPVYIDVLVDTDSIAAMHAVAEFLESHEDAGKINLYPEPGRYGAAGMVAKHVNMELIPEIAAIEGVLRVEKESVVVPSSQSGSVGKESPTETPIPTATPYPDDCLEITHATEDRMETVCPEPGPRKIEQDLRKMYNDFMVEKELAAQEGRSSTLGAIRVQVMITTSTTDAVDDVVAFLEENGVRVLGSSKESSVHSAGRVNALLSIELLPGIIAIEGVGGVVEVHQDRPGGSNLHLGPGSMTAVGRMFVDHWHEAGVTGAGVEVAVIDADFLGECTS